MANEVSIVVTAKDRSKPGLASARASARAMLAQLSKDAGDSGDETGNRLASGIRSGLAKVLSAGMLKAVAAGAATAFAVPFLAQVASALASGAAKLAHGFAAGLALLPAAALAAGMAVGTLKLALSGMGDTISSGLSGDTEAFNESLKGLSPSARSVAREVVGLRGRLDDLKSRVQENFFGPLVGQIRPLAEIYLRQANLAMGHLGRTFGQVGNQVSQFLQTPAAFQAIWVALDNGVMATDNLARGVGSLVQAFLPLLSVGSTFLPGLTAGFGGATASLAAFMQEAERTGRLAAFIQGGIDKLKSLWATAKQIGRIFADIGAIGATVWAALGIETGGLLDSIERVTDRVRQFIQSAEGATVLQGIFAAISIAVLAIKGPLGALLTGAGSALGSLIPQLAEFAVALAALAGAILEIGIDALTPVFSLLASVLSGAVLPALTALATWLADNQPVLQGIGIAIMTLLIPAFVAWAISAGAAAIATLLAMAPIILLGAAIAALAALVIIHFDTIKRWISNVFNWVRDNWPLLLAILTGPFGMAVYLIVTHWQTIKDAATAAKDWIGDRISDIASFFTGLPGRVAGVGAAIWDGITGAIDSVKDSIGDAVDWVVDKISAIGDAISNIPGAGVIRDIAGAIPGFAHGGNLGGGRGMRLVGERGPELIRGGTGGHVIPANTTRARLAGAGGGGSVVNVYVQGSVIDTHRDLVQVLRDARDRGEF